MKAIYIFIFLGGIILGISILLAPSHNDIGELNTLPYELNGNKSSKLMIVFLHGYPNTFRLWDKMIDELKSDALCLNLSYPNFSKDVRRKWGIDIDDLIKLIKKTVDHVDPENKYKKVFVAHDWGAAFSYMFDNDYPGYVSELITLDVGAGTQKTFRALLGLVSYQTYLASNFLIGGKIGNYLTNLFVDGINVWGLTSEDRQRIDSSWNYLYYYVWKRILYYKTKLTRYKPSCPVSYIYGTKKPFMFHDDSFIDLLKQNSKSEVHTVDEGHWIMNNHHQFILNLIKRRIAQYL